MTKLKLFKITKKKKNTFSRFLKYLNMLLLGHLFMDLIFLYYYENNKFTDYAI